MTTAERIQAADEYLAARTGHYTLRCERYDAALEAMHTLGLSDECTVFDVGSGWGEFAARMHGHGVHARYIPVDAGIDGTDLDHWTPPRHADFFVALELLEHLNRPQRLITEMKRYARRGVIVSTPNPRTTDVLGMDATHLTSITAVSLEMQGLKVREESFYGREADSLFAVWRRSMSDACQGTYQATLKCRNCGDWRVVEIPQGLSMRTYCHPSDESDRPRCRRCGCKTLAPLNAR